MNIQYTKFNTIYSSKLEFIVNRTLNNITILMYDGFRNFISPDPVNCFSSQEALNFQHDVCVETYQRAAHAMFCIFR